MRVLYVSHTHPSEDAILDNVGGMQRVSRQLIDEWQSWEEIDVYEEAVNVAGRGLVALQTTFFLLRLLVTLAAKARRTDADVILFSSMVTASLAWFLRKRINIPMVTINHGRDVTLKVGIYQQFLPRVFDALDGVISVSSATRDECIKRGMKPENGIALANGFDLQKMNNLTDKRVARTELAKKFDIPVKKKKMLLTVGRQVERKGHAWFINEVFPRLPSDMVYVMIGDGPERDNIEKAVQQSAGRERIFLLGSQPDRILKRAYSAADLFIMPNIPVDGDMEGFGIVLVEANLARTPAIASDLEGIKDVIANGKNGYKVPPLDADKFAAAVKEIVETDLEQSGRKARHYVKKQFAWARVAQDYKAYLSEIIDHYAANKSKIT